MPYRLMRRDCSYYVVDEEGKKYSKKPLSKEKARKQMIALNMAHAKKKGDKKGETRKAKPKIANPTVIAMKAEKIGEMVKEADKKEMEGKQKEAMSLKDRIDALKEERKAHKMEEKVEEVEMAEKPMKTRKRIIKLQRAVSSDEENLDLMEFSKMTQPQRKKLYEKYADDGRMPEEVSPEAQRGYKIFLTKKQR